MYSTTVTITPPFPISLDSLAASWMRGHQDPLVARGRGSRSLWTSARLSGIHLTIRLEQENRSAPSERLLAPIHATLWVQKSSGASAALEQLAHQIPLWVGVADDWSDFMASPAWHMLPTQLRRIRRDHPGLRLGATHQLFWHGVSSISEQRVTGIEAMGGLRALLRKTADPLPHTGASDQPEGMVFFPGPERLLSLPSWFWHRAGYDAARAGTVLGFARRIGSLERLERTATVADLAGALATIPGVGPWTVAEIVQRTHGHPDAVSVGDYHLARWVGWAFERQPADDARMLELLAPFAGNRNRVVALIKAGRIQPPRRGARLAPEDFRHM